MDRILIRGTSGSGKTTLGLEIAHRLGVPAIDLDELYWLPGWQTRSPEDFRERVRAATAAPRWALSGNYSKVDDLTLPPADTAVWLDYSLPLVFGRVLRRTILRCLRGDPCCNGNREEFRKSFLRRDSVIWWSLTTHGKRRRECDAFMAETPPPGQVRLRHRSPRETAAWLAEI